MIVKGKVKVQILFIILLICSSLNILAATPDQPYMLIIDAIERGDIDRAYHWIKTTETDFPNSEEARLAKYLRIPLCSATIWGNCELANAYLKGARNGAKNARFYVSLISPAIYGSILANTLSDFFNDYSNDKIYNFRLKFPKIDEDSWLEAELMLTTIAIGVEADKSPVELSNLLRLKWLSSSISLFKSMETIDKIGRAKLFIDLARVLQISIMYIDVDETTKNVLKDSKPIMLNMALKCAEYAIELTKDNPYTDIHVDAKQIMEDISKLKV
ncbi:MAG: hypothetical protein K6U03_01315 [Firmicutes bacterium]|nr:hypothetical protein [Bacillota bacterium]